MPSLALPLALSLAVWNELAHVNSSEFSRVMAWLVQTQLHLLAFTTDHVKKMSGYGEKLIVDKVQ